MDNPFSSKPLAIPETQDKLGLVNEQAAASLTNLFYES